MDKDANRLRDETEYFRQIEQEIRRGREFSLAAAIGEEGGGLLSGGTPISATQEAAALVTVFLSQHLDDSAGTLRQLLGRRITDDIVLLDRHVDAPLGALAETLDRILASDERIYDLVHRVDAEYGRMMAERPHFQVPGGRAHPDDEYTHASVRSALAALRAVLSGPSSTSPT